MHDDSRIDPRLLRTLAARPPNGRLTGVFLVKRDGEDLAGLVSRAARRCGRRPESVLELPRARVVVVTGAPALITTCIEDAAVDYASAPDASPMFERLF